MRAYRIEKKVSQHGKVELDALPFEAGEMVEIIVLARDQNEIERPVSTSLKDSVLAYVDPTESVAQDDWSALQ